MTPSSELSTGVHDDPVEAVHEARKSLKKARSLLRLSRGTLDPGERRRENAALRDAGRELSAARDAEVMLEAIDDLAERSAGRVPQATLRRHPPPPRGRARPGSAGDCIDSGLTAQVAEELGPVRDRIDDWPLRRAGWKALEPGLHRSYARGRAGLEQARSRPDGREPSRLAQAHQGPLVPPAPAGADLRPGHRRRRTPRRPTSSRRAPRRRPRPGRAARNPRDSAGELTVDLDAVFGLIDHRREQLQAEAIVLGAAALRRAPQGIRRASAPLLEGVAPAGRRTPAAQRPGYPGMGASFAASPRGARHPVLTLPSVRRPASSNRRVCCQKRNVKSGQIVALRPLASRYQLEQPPVFHTVPSSRDCRWRVVGLVGVASHLDLGGAASLHRLERVHQVVELRLDHEHHRVVAEPRVRPDDPEQVREAGHRGAAVGLRAAVPRVVETARRRARG